MHLYTAHVTYSKQRFTYRLLHTCFESASQFLINERYRKDGVYNSLSSACVANITVYL